MNVLLSSWVKIAIITNVWNGPLDLKLCIEKKKEYINTTTLKPLQYMGLSLKKWLVNILTIMIFFMNVKFQMYDSSYSSFQVMITSKPKLLQCMLIFA